VLSFLVYPEPHPRQPVIPSQTLEIFPPRTVTYFATAHPVSPLSATLMELRASVANKRLTENITPLDATLTKNWGEGAIFQLSNAGSASRMLLRDVQICSSHPRCSRGTCNDLRSISFAVTFLATPHPLTPLLSHSYKNHRGWGQVCSLALYALRPKSVSQLDCIQPVPHSFSKNGGVWGSQHPTLKELLEVFRRRMAAATLIALVSSNSVNYRQGMHRV
jgi:hypothetical protein